jgi:molecular chaperone HtpG
MPIKIPEALDAKLRSENSLFGEVASTLDGLEQWIADSKVVFFPEYTDHGVGHVNAVLETASALVTENSWSLLTPADAAVLVISAVVHDCALHLSEDSFVSMISCTARLQTQYFQDPAWSQVWSEFLAIASRFDGVKLKMLFGDLEPVHAPPSDPQQMTRRDRLIIGEFLRRHHPRVAQEVALFGIPGVTPRRVEVVKTVAWVRELSGLVARSHGMPIRQAADLIHRDQRRNTRGVHLPYVMALLRIADYLQIQSDRAPVSLLSVRMLRSPLSVGEWQLHKSVYDVNWTHDDPEAVFVEIRPESAHTFLRARSLLQSIQRELDESWAVLGEVYGRCHVPPLDQLGLQIRRIRSNLENEEALATALPFAPSEARFDTSRGELLKLLVRPLYGEHPEFGIRELLQNSVDACRERIASSERYGVPLVEPSVTIRIEQEHDETYWLTVEDSGIGMTLDTIRNFFLKAGASFRSSEVWRKQYLDATGQSRVLRSGRFGVGVLAAFLLGDAVEMTTRHAGASRGLRLQAGLDDENIEIRYVDREPGTTVRVRLDNKELAQKLVTVPPKERSYWDYPGKEWDFYTLANPAVCRFALSKQQQQALTIPGPNSDLPSIWRRVSAEGFEDVHWTFWKTGIRG